MKWGRPLSEFMKGFCNLCEALDKSPVVISESQEALYFPLRGGNWPLLNLLNLAGIGRHSFSRDDVAEVANLGLEKGTLFRLQLEPCPPNAVEDRLQILQVLRE